MSHFNIKNSLLFFLIVLIPLSAIGDEQSYSVSPKLNNGNKWRIACYEGGEYANYQDNLIAIVKELMNLGWIEKTEIPPQKGIQTKELWNWLSSNAESKYLQFLKDGHYNAKWDKELRKKMSDEIINRMNTQKDIDLFFAIGTWAGQDFANDRHKTPTMVISVSDAITAGIVKIAEDSGYDHVHVRVDPFLYDRQIRSFHNVIRFKKLGIVYEDSIAGRSYAAIDTAEKLAKIKGFEIIRCYIKYNTADIEARGKNVIDCFKELVTKADAIYVTMQSGVNSRTIPELVKIASSSRIPTFSQAGKNEVKQGILMTISPADLSYIGNFYAETAAKIMNGATPRKLSMFFNQPYKWEFNFETAEKIGLDLSKIDLENDYMTFPDFSEND